MSGLDRAYRNSTGQLVEALTLLHTFRPRTNSGIDFTRPARPSTTDSGAYRLTTILRPRLPRVRLIYRIAVFFSFLGDHLRMNVRHPRRVVSPSTYAGLEFFFLNYPFLRNPSRPRQGRLAGSITAPVFLKAFAEGAEAKDSQEPAMKWAHIDTAGSMEVRS
jgi:hypothetical protein